MKKLDFFDVTDKVDLARIDAILNTKTIIKQELVQFTYLMIEWDETIL